MTAWVVSIPVLVVFSINRALRAALTASGWVVSTLYRGVEVIESKLQEILGFQQSEAATREIKADPEADAKARTDLSNRLRAIRVMAETLKGVLQAVHRGEMELKDHAEYTRSLIDRMNRQVRCLGEGNRRLLGDLSGEQDEGRGCAPARYSDSITSIEEWWGVVRQILVEARLPGEPTGDAGESKEMLARRQATVVERYLDQIIEMAVWRTCCERINAWARLNDPGDIVSFHRIFADELPDSGRRERILGLLESKPLDVPSVIIDPETGLMFRCADAWYQSLGRFLALLIAALLALVGLYVYHLFDQLSVEQMSGLVPQSAEQLKMSSVDWSFMLQNVPEFRYLAGGWISVLFGMIIHSAVARRKRRRTETADFSLPLGRWHTYVLARVDTVIAALAWSVGAVIAYDFVFLGGEGGEPKNITAYEAFLLGYGLDSFVEMLGKKADQWPAKVSGSGASTGK
ncbi:MAG: hypothetical protein R6X02_34145 [Enhygromyxa sp.]